MGDRQERMARRRGRTTVSGRGRRAASGSNRSEGPLTPRALYGIADLHVEVPENRRLLESLRAAGDGDWLIVAGDVGEIMADIEWGLATLAERFEQVIWVPGNHELWTHPHDPIQLRGTARYEAIVAYCRRIGVLTPEDPYPLWEGPGGPVVIAPLFTLYDYSYGVNIAPTQARALMLAHQAGVVCSDELVLHPTPYRTREEWCRERIAATVPRLDAVARTGARTVLVNHWPLLRELTDVLYRPEFAQWCGTTATDSWHLRYRAAAVVYGHLHIRRGIERDGVRFEEVSLGYPTQWARSGDRPPLLRRLPLATAGANGSARNHRARASSAL